MLRLGQSRIPCKRPLLTHSHFSNTLADTLASELGILSALAPRSILTFRPVPPGTNGGISWTGIQASVLGGALMGLTMVIDLCIETSPRGAFGSSSSVLASKIGSFGSAGWGGEMILFAAVAGLAGSLVRPTGRLC